MKPSCVSTASAGSARVDWLTGNILGMPVQRTVRKLGQLSGVFSDRKIWQSMNPETVVYSVQWQEPVPQETRGGLFWGSTTIEAGRVGDEYFMTRGHFHSKRDCAEYYCTIQGQGMLVLMDEERLTRVEIMSPGSLHYIPGYTAHRAVNTGDTPLLFWACWPSDAGHDYDTIAEQLFGARVFHRDGAPEVVLEEPRPQLRQTAQQEGTR
jgi:glucose-6-phosphate isomerase